MKSFADLYTELDRTTRTNEKVAALARYFRSVDAAEAAWALFFLGGRRFRRAITYPRLRQWALDAAALPSWLFDECQDAVGDFAETVALLVPPTAQSSARSLDSWVRDWLIPLGDTDEASQRRLILGAWAQMSADQVFVWNKLITGAFRVGVSQLLVTRALSKVSGLPPATIAHRLMGSWSPSPEFFQRLLAPVENGDDLAKPYPFFLAHPLEAEPRTLGELAEWHLEWKWDGIRCQVIRRGGQTFLWSRGEDLMTSRFPEVTDACARLPDGTVLDGEILPWRDGHALPFLALQRRITRKTLTRRLLHEVPAIFMAFDLLEHEGHDVRVEPLLWRRSELQRLVHDRLNGPSTQLSPRIEAASWDDVAALRQESRNRHVEGIMLKRITSRYGVGRQRGDWWKWKIEPFAVDAVLIYAQRGSGKRASLYTDYTFGVWDQGELVPFAKAYSGLTDAEIRKVDAFIRRNTTEKFGPVRTVKPQLVFELVFESIQVSTRHRSGVAVRFPRIKRWRTDKKIDEADTLDRVRALIPPQRQTRAARRRKALEEEGPSLFDAVPDDPT